MLIMYSYTVDKNPYYEIKKQTQIKSNMLIVVRYTFIPLIRLLYVVSIHLSIPAFVNVYIGKKATCTCHSRSCRNCHAYKITNESLFI